ncbi:DUF3710 domain-containing protein [Rhodococcus pyridinivorans]|uniref:DUF3710 domain-containing protein n=1 Tax=Rhodococcus pyridinivorans AK37 TaxID=1114960 RepID=H0JP17_9NOCA|nr:DUF3710 domain-containing protein [Rhodococcus pyridinivorans]EHK84593.1 hypothetical protein AK37_06848 [Rhodococcus pyridinivorans AK37]MCD2139976.1 DUF3710 domain-containing protein [Rhodococcus pyridinivorans]
MFGRRRKDRGSNIEATDAASAGDLGAYDEPADEEYDEYATGSAADSGPYDIDEVDEETVTASRLDLGSVLVPLPAGGQIQVEMAPNGTPQNVHLVTQFGRITVSAYAAPKSPGQWREVAAELAETLRNDKAEVSIESGPWGRELHGRTANADLRFIGVDGFRWMIRCVVAAPSGNAGADSELVGIARSVISGTVVRRGSEPHPVRTPLPIVLPEALTRQLVAAQEQQQQAAAQQQGAAPAQPAPRTAPPEQPAQQTRQVPPARQTPPRRGESGSAMQQLGF